MAGGDSRGVGAGFTMRPHAFDPVLSPELFEGVLPRRIIAFIIDLIVVFVPILIAGVLIFVFGVITLGIGWALYWLLSPAAVIWALVYYGATLGGPASATLGMRLVDLEMRLWYGERCNFLLGAAHPLLFWITTSALTPLVLLVCFFNMRRRLLHDMLLGLVVINRLPRAAPAGRWSAQA